jgi:lysophospholipase L1-like esterase
MLCKEAKCPLFDEHHNLLTYDGFHLTEAGARLLGQRLKQHALLAPLQTR